MLEPERQILCSSPKLGHQHNYGHFYAKTTANNQVFLLGKTEEELAMCCH